MFSIFKGCEKKEPEKEWSFHTYVDACGTMRLTIVDADSGVFLADVLEIAPGKPFNRYNIEKARLGALGYDLRHVSVNSHGFLCHFGEQPR